MKLSASVPDELWIAVNPEGSSPSEIVQLALNNLVESRVAQARPLANAPDQAHLDRYQADFDKAVAATEHAVREVLDAGYQFGLLLAPGMTLEDFDLLDGDEIKTHVRNLLLEWGGNGEPLKWCEDLAWSWTMQGHTRALLDTVTAEPADDPDTSAMARRIEELLGDPHDSEGVGVEWLEHPDGNLVPKINDSFARGAVAALRDVRDETRRRIDGVTTKENR